MLLETLRPNSRHSIKARHPGAGLGGDKPDLSIVESFERITVLAANLFSAPGSVLSLLDHDGLCITAWHGLDGKQIGRLPDLGSAALLHSQPWLQPEAKTDCRVANNPWRAAGSEFGFCLGVPLRTAAGVSLGTLCVIDRAPHAVTDQQVQDLTRLAALAVDQMEVRLAARRAVANLEKVIREKEAALQRALLLTQEIDHRVMNSLQLISGLLKVQHRSLGNSEGAEQLALAAGRISAIALVHRHLYRHDPDASTDCQAYLEGLCRDLSQTLRQAHAPDIAVEVIAAPLTSERLIPLGLIVAELVTNAAKHGEGQITVAMGSTPGGFALSVSDEGPGLPLDYHPTKAGGLGTKVIIAMAEQLGGQLLVGPGKNPGRLGFLVAFPA